MLVDQFDIKVVVLRAGITDGQQLISEHLSHLIFDSVERQEGLLPEFRCK